MISMYNRILMLLFLYLVKGYFAKEKYNVTASNQAQPSLFSYLVLYIRLYIILIRTISREKI